MEEVIEKCCALRRVNNVKILDNLNLNLKDDLSSLGDLSAELSGLVGCDVSVSVIYLSFAYSLCGAEIHEAGCQVVKTTGSV